MPGTITSVEEWFNAIQQGQVDLIRTHAADYAKCLNGDGETGLMIAAREGNVELVKILGFFENGVTNSEGKTAIMLAAEANKGEVCKRLVAYEANKVYGGFSMTPLMIAAECGATTAVSNLLPYLKGRTDSRGRTALMYAAAAGHTEVVKLLVVREKEMISHDNKTAFVLAAENGHTEIIQCLASYEANLIPEYTRASLMSFSSSQVGNNQVIDLSLSISLIDAHRLPGAQSGTESLTQTKTQLERELETKIVQLEMKLASLHDESSVVIGQNVALHNQVKNMEENITTLRIEINRLQSETTDKDAIISDLKERITDLEAERLTGALGIGDEELKQKLVALQAELEEKKREIKDLKEKAENVASPSGDATIFAEYENKIKALEQALDARAAELDQVRLATSDQERAAGLEKELAELRAIIDARNARIEELEQAAVGGEDESYANMVLEEEIENLRSSILAKDAEIAELQNRLREAPTDAPSEAFDEIIAAKNAEISRLQDLLQRAEAARSSAAAGDSRVAELEGQIAELKNLLATSQTGGDERIKDLEERIADLEFELTSAKEDVDARDDEIDLLRERIETELKANAELRDKLTVMEAETTRPHDEAGYLARIDELQRQVEDFVQQLAKKSANADVVLRKAEEVAPREVEAAPEVDAVAVQALEKQIVALQDEIVARDNQIQELTDLLKETPVREAGAAEAAPVAGAPAAVDDARLSELTTENDRLKDKLASLQEQLDAAKRAHADEARDFHSQIAHLNAEISRINDLVATASASAGSDDVERLVELQEELEDVREQLLSYKDKYETALEEAEQMRKELEARPTQATTYIEGAEDTGANAKLIEELRQEIQGLNDEIQSLNDESKILHGQNREQKEELERIRAELQEKTGIIGDLNQQLTNATPKEDARVKLYEDEIAGLKAVIDARDGAIRELEQKVKALEDIEKALESKEKAASEKDRAIKLLADKVKQLEEDFFSAQERATEAQLNAASTEEPGTVECVDAQTEISDVDPEEQAKIASVLDADEGLIQKINELQYLVDTLSRGNESYKDEHDKIIAETEALKRELRDLGLENDSLETDNGRLLKQIKDLAETVEDLRKKLDVRDAQPANEGASPAEVAALRKEIDDLRNEVSTLNGKVKDKNQKISDLEKELVASTKDVAGIDSDRLNALMTDVEDSKNKLEEAKRTIADLNEQLAAKNAELASAAGQLGRAAPAEEDGAAKARIAFLENETATLREQLDNKLAEIDRVHQNLLNSDNEAARLREEMTALKAAPRAAEPVAAAAPMEEDTERMRMLEDQLQDSRKEIADLRCALEANEALIEDLQEKVSVVDPELANKLEISEASVRELTEKLEALQDEIAVLTEKAGRQPVEQDQSDKIAGAIDQLNDELAATKNMIAERDETIDVLKQQIDAGEEVTELKSKIDELNEEVAMLNGILEERETEIAEMRNQLETQPTAPTVYQEPIEAVGDMAVLKDLQDENTILREEVETKGALINDLQEEIGVLKQQCEDLKNDMLSLESGNNERIIDLQAELDENKRQIKELQEEVDVLKNTANDVDPAVVDSLQDEIQKLSAELSAREDSITELQELLTEQEGKNATLNAQLAQATSDLETLRGASGRDESVNGERVSALESEIGTLQEALDKANEEVAQKSDEYSRASSEMINLRKAIEYYKKLVDDIRSGIVDLDENLGSLDLQ